MYLGAPCFIKLRGGSHRRALPALSAPEHTVRSLDLGHGGHEGVLVEVVLDLLHNRLLVRRVQLLGELDGLEGGEAAAHVVDDGNALGLGGGQTCKAREHR